MEQEKIKTQAKFYKNKKITNFYASLIFLFITILLTSLLYFYNLSIEKNIKQLETNINTKTKSINELKKDKNIVISNLYKENLSTIKKLNNYSKITTFINHLYKLRRIYNIDLKGFNYSN
jgi:cell division protein FtsL